MLPFATEDHQAMRFANFCARSFRSLVLAGAFVLGGNCQASEDSYKTASDVLAVGVPLVAAVVSVVQDDASGVLQLSKSEALTLLSVELLKRTTNKTRPNGRDDRSFPSGHTAVAFAAAQYMQMRGGWRYGVPAYLAAAATGYSRVRAKEHYWRDVLAGAAIGIASSYYFTDSRERMSFGMMFGRDSVYAHIHSTW